MGVKEEEFIRRMHEGISPEDAHVLVLEVEAEKAREEAPKTNLFRFDNPIAQRLSDMWFSQRSTATVEQKDRVGMAYIAKFLGLGSEVAERFVQDDWQANEQVGLMQSSVPPLDTAEFWKEVQEIFPDVYTDGDMEWLVTQGGIYAVFHFEWQLDTELAEDSPVLRALNINAHAYK